MLYAAELFKIAFLPIFKNCQLKKQGNFILILYSEMI